MSRNDKPWYKRWWFISIVALFALSSVLNSAEDDAGDSSNPTVLEETVVTNAAGEIIETSESATVEPEEDIVARFDDMTVLSWRPERGEYGNRYVTGMIRNDGDSPKSYAQVEITLLGSQGEVIGSTIDNVAGLRPGESWRFRAIVLEEGVTDYRIDGVTAY